MANGDLKDLARRTALDRVSEIKQLILLKIQNMMDVKDVLLLWFINFLIKKTASLADKSTSVSGVNNEIKQKQQIADELCEPIIRKF